MPYFPHTPELLIKLFPQFLWRVGTSEQKLYLTFDDGPHPKLTPWVLEVLAKHDTKALFFMIGDNVRKFPAVAKQVAAAGHLVGNHSFSHLNGWKSPNHLYLQDVQRAQSLIEDTLGSSPIHFRPPYGKIGYRQAKALLPHYQIVLMDILCGDFDTEIDGNTCTQRILAGKKNGSIVVYHDSTKAEDRLRVSLPDTLQSLKTQGWALGNWTE